LLYNKHIPAYYLRASLDQRLLLLQGLMDTDGCWNTARDEAVFNSTDENLARQVKELLLTLGQRPYMSSALCTGFGLTVTSYSVRFAPIDNFMPFRLPRKAGKVKYKARPLSRRRMIKSIEPGPDVETVCIAVDSPNRTYLCTENFIPTHNTGSDEPRYSLGCTTQCAIYSRGHRYRDALFPGTPAFEDGSPNPDETAWRKPLWPNVNQKSALMLHVPLEKVDGKYVADLYHLDLELGWKSLMMGLELQAARRHPKLKKIS